MHRPAKGRLSILTAFSATISVLMVNFSNTAGTNYQYQGMATETMIDDSEEWFPPSSSSVHLYAQLVP